MHCATYFAIGVAAGIFSKKAKPLARAALKQGLIIVGAVQEKTKQLKEEAQSIIAEAKADAS